MLKNELRLGKVVTYSDYNTMTHESGYIKTIDPDKVIIFTPYSNKDKNNLLVVYNDEIKNLNYMGDDKNNQEDKPIKVLSFDPGITTGYCLTTIYPDDSIFQINCIGTCEYNPIEINHTFTVLSMYSPHVVIEEYKSNVLNQEQKKVVELLGMFKYFCARDLIKPIAQYPSQRQGYLNMAKDLLLNENNMKLVVHEVDALAHNLRYIEKVLKFNGLAVFKNANNTK